MPVDASRHQKKINPTHINTVVACCYETPNDKRKVSISIIYSQGTNVVYFVFHYHEFWMYWNTAYNYSTLVIIMLLGSEERIYIYPDYCNIQHNMVALGNGTCKSL